MSETEINDDGGGEMRVLVYENSKDRAKLIQDLLGRYRYKVEVKYDSPATIEGIQNLKPTLIILNMNNKNHLELLDKMGNNSRLSKIPMILISSDASGVVIEKTRNFSNVDFLVEPFKIKNFRHLVERWITLRSLYVN